MSEMVNVWAPFPPHIVDATIAHIGVALKAVCVFICAFQRCFFPFLFALFLCFLSIWQCNPSLMGLASFVSQLLTIDTFFFFSFFFLPVPLNLNRSPDFTVVQRGSSIGGLAGDHSPFLIFFKRNGVV